MKTIRILSLILALLMLATAFVACNNDDQPADTDTPDVPEDTNVELKLVSLGQAKYDIVYDYSASQKVREAVNALVVAYKTYLNADVTVRECFSDRDGVEEDIVSDNEILIGKTNRPESLKAIEGKRTGDYSVDIDGTKLVIAGGSDDATHNAVVAFMTTFVYEQGDKNAVRQGASLSLTVDKKTTDTLTMTGKYSFSKTVVAGARIDSYAVVYNGADMTYRDQELATKVQSHIYKQAGYEISLYKDSNIVKADYMISIGETMFVDAALAEKIGANDYHIELKQTETGAILFILYGEAAGDAVWKAFNELFPPSSDPVEVNLAAGVLKTTLQ